MKIKRLIELTAPSRLLNFGNGSQTETTKGDIVQCECCNGHGGKYINSYCITFDFSKNNGNGYYEACKMCKGSGQVQTTISVEWQSAGDIKEEYK